MVGQILVVQQILQTLGVPHFCPFKSSAVRVLKSSADSPSVGNDILVGDEVSFRY